MNILNQLLGRFGSDTAQGKVLFILIITLLVSLLCWFVVSRMMQHSIHSKNPWDDAFSQALGPPLQLLVWVVGLSIVLNLVQVPVDSGFANILDAARDLSVILAIAWFLMRFVRLAQDNVVTNQTEPGKHIDKVAVDAIAKISRLIVCIVATLGALQTLGFSIAGVLTFGGVGGIAIGFAAKDLLSNFFGGLMIYLDGPFTQGDWIRSPDREIEGTVEHIGWRVTWVRNFDSRPLYIPNSAFATVTLENVSRMTNRRIYETIGIRYEDAGAMERIITQVSDYLKSHAEIDQNQTLMVNFTTFAPSSLDFFIYCFTKTRSGPKFNQIKQGVLLHIFEIIGDNNAECAFPTTTVQLQGEFIQSK